MDHSQSLTIALRTTACSCVLFNFIDDTVNTLHYPIPDHHTDLWTLGRVVIVTGTVPNPGSAPKRPRTDGVPKSAKAKKSAKSKSGPKNWGIPRSEVPDSAAGLQRAMNLHSRILMGLLSQSAVPICLPADLMNQFEQRFSSPEDLDAQLNGRRLLTYRKGDEQPNSLRCRASRRPSMYNAVANIGLHVFAPDVFGNPESLYNLTHEHVAIHSFRTIAYSSIYRVDLSLIKDDHFLRRFYRSFIYGRMKDLASKEERCPGRVGVDIVLNNIYRRRDETQALRVAQIADDCFMNKTVAPLAAENECHSDDEELADGSAFMVHEKPGRDSAVSAFFEVLTARRETAISQKRKKGAWHRHIRKRGLPPSDLSRARPTNFFNDLSVRDRAIYMNNGVALPTAEHCQTWTDIVKWKGLGKVDFMAQYGKAKLALYELPTEAELAALDNDSMDDDD
ncbi:hypothetical protein B0H14DRAFT_2588226 [Mycena olivaceomarginata]|nr:hypothetical protein B0H14DRAFT_2588226 [Mycena olivaceomarginata]